MSLGTDPRSWWIACVCPTRPFSTDRLPELPPWSLSQIAQIDVEPIEDASRIPCGNHHHIDELQKCFPAEVHRWRNDLDGNGAGRIINSRDFAVPVGCFRSALQQRCDRRVVAGDETAFDSSRSPVLYSLALQGQP